MNKYLFIFLLGFFLNCSSDKDDAQVMNEEPSNSSTIAFESDKEIYGSHVDEIEIVLTFSEDASLTDINDFYIGDIKLSFTTSAESIVNGKKKYSVKVPIGCSSGNITVRDKNGKVIATGPYVNYEKIYVVANTQPITDALEFNPAICKYGANEVLCWKWGAELDRKFMVITSFDKLLYNGEHICTTYEMNMQTSDVSLVAPDIDKMTWLLYDVVGMAYNGSEAIFYQSYSKNADNKYTNLLKWGPGAGTVEYYREDIASNNFSIIYDIEVDKNNNLYVIDDKATYIQIIEPLAMPRFFVGNESSGFIDDKGEKARFSTIKDMAIDKDGNIYVADGNSIRFVTSGGHVSTIAGGLDSGDKLGDMTVALFSDIKAIALASNEKELYILDAGNKAIKIMDLNTKKIRKIRTLASSELEFSGYDVYKAAMVVTDDGIIYVVAREPSSKFYYLRLYIPEEIFPKDFNWHFECGRILKRYRN